MSPSEKGEKESSFKVVDRRRFDESGLERSASEDDGSKEKQNPPPSAKSEQKSEKQEARSAKPIDFSLFLHSLAQQALMALGLIAWPGSGLIERRLDVARETIDIITMLKEKTAGNLDAGEQRLMDTLLYELQMTFVQISSMPAADLSTAPDQKGS